MGGAADVYRVACGLLESSEIGAVVPEGSRHCAIRHPTQGKTLPAVLHTRDRT
jgi:hypothetical protein